MGYKERVYKEHSLISRKNQEQSLVSPRKLRNSQIHALKETVVLFIKVRNTFALGKTRSTIIDRHEKSKLCNPKHYDDWYQDLIFYFRIPKEQTIEIFGKNKERLVNTTSLNFEKNQERDQSKKNLVPYKPYCVYTQYGQ